MAPVYDHIRNTLDNRYSNRQFADKACSWKAKFRGSEDKEKANSLSFRTPHETAIYNVCRQLWGGQDEGGAENEEIDEDRSSGLAAKLIGKPSMNGKEKQKKLVVPKEQEEVEEDMQKAEEEEYQGVKEEEEGKNGPKSKNTVAKSVVVANDLAKPKTE